jgi:hypothetical protein
MLADQGDRDVYVARARPVAGGPDEGLVVADVEDSRYRDRRGVAQARVLHLCCVLRCGDGHRFSFQGSPNLGMLDWRAGAARK